MPTTDNTATKPVSSNKSPAKKVRTRSKPVEPPKEHKTAWLDVEPREYNAELIEDFLDMVFHSGMSPDGEVLVWAVDKGRKPVYPITEDALSDFVTSSRKGKALYYGTASCRRDHTGKIFNRQALFERLHVVVLDDIGTKGGELPEALQKPTYILESSEGNFQYGYVLETPIDCLDASKALVKLMYEAGIADAGGKMPNKLVRLPEGINGKPGAKTNFVSKLITMDGPLWTPQALLDAVDAGVSWDEVLKDGEEAAVKRRVRLKAGTTPWAPYRPVHASMSGVIDPVLEWLEENDQIVSENGDWVTVKCPYAAEHTSGDDTAGYKPLGVGEEPNRRAFHCFHDSCTSQHTQEYLQFVAALGGPSASAKDDAAEMVAAYAYDSVNDCAWKVRDTEAPIQITMSGMRNTHPRKVLVASPDGKLRPAAEYNQWLTSESRVTVMGVTFAPSTTARIVEKEDALYVNQFTPPTWGSGKSTGANVDKFIEYVEYLIPTEREREYFLDWLAAKCQDMGFRGAAIVMVAKSHGIGRSTLADMITTLLGKVNSRHEPFSNIVGDSPYNDWLEAPFIVSDETLNTGGLNCYKTYEKLKELIDPRPRLATINPKYGKQRRSMVHSSFLFLSNHGNALALNEDDRRLYVISNPHKAAKPKYFVKLNEWLSEVDDKGKPAWAGDVFRWLCEREIDIEKLLAPPETTAAKREMIEASRSDIDTAAQSILRHWPSEYISVKQFEEAVENFAARLNLYEISNYRNQLKRILSSSTYTLDPKAVVRVDGRSMRPKVIAERATPTTVEEGGEFSNNQRLAVRNVLVKDNIDAAIEKVSHDLDVEGL